MTAYLPITAMWWYPDAHDDGPRRVIAPAGLPVHSVVAGRVTRVDAQAVGTVVVRDDHERFHHYRRLQASSITVRMHDTVDGGTVLGVIARPSDGSMPALLYGVHDAEERWLDAGALLLGADDPAELGITVGALGDLVVAPSAASPAPSDGSGPAAGTGGPLPHSTPRPPEKRPADDPAPPPPPPDGSGQPVRSRLAARRPPRRSS